MNLSITTLGNPEAASRALGRLVTAADKALEKNVIQASILQQTIWISGIRDGKFGLKKLSKITEYAKGSSKPLIDHGDYLRSIKRHRIGRYAYAVGVHKNARRRDTQAQPTGGGSLYNLAEVHEHGAIIKPRIAKALAIPMTRKASRAGSPLNYPDPLTFVRAKSGNRLMYGVFLAPKDERKNAKAKSRVAYLLMLRVKIPARPNLKPAFKEFLKQAPVKLDAGFHAMLKAELGGR